MVPLLLGEQTGDGSQAPVHVWLFEARSRDASGFKLRAKMFQLSLVANRQVNVAGVRCILGHK